MFCNKCGTQFDDTQTFCPNCGERMEAQKKAAGKGGVKPRRQYNTAVFVVISWFLGGLIIGINDFYAGFNKMGAFRTLGPVAGIALFALGANMGMPLLYVIGAIPLVVSFFIGIWELFQLSEVGVMLENGQSAMFRAIDLKLDFEGVSQYCINTYGSALARKKRG